jgi:hypothetical protein
MPLCYELMTTAISSLGSPDGCEIAAVRLELAKPLLLRGRDGRSDSDASTTELEPSKGKNLTSHRYKAREYPTHYI